MSTRLSKEIGNLKQEILALGTAVEDRVRLAVDAVRHRDADLAVRVIEGDREIDEMEVDLEEECLKVLALHQPMAVDLRYIVAVLKINSDLERIGDLAVNIAERGAILASHPPVRIPFDLDALETRTREMLRQSLDALVLLDPEAARGVCARDQEVDDLNRQVYDIVRGELREDPARLDTLTPLLNVSRSLERIADHATNIAEDVIYLSQGEIVRHHVAGPRPRPPAEARMDGGGFPGA
jgi:phosphate transport system protein